MYDNLNAEDIKQNTDMLVKLHGEFADFFRISTRSVAPQGLDYLKSQLPLAMLFLLRLKRKLAPKAPMLTLKDSLEILKIVMPKKEAFL
jgi:hypothetical protein